MRITRRMLLSIAEDQVAEHARQDQDIIAAYLSGALLQEQPLLGGTADIDLVFIHQDQFEDHQVVRLTQQVHLDIVHHPQALYQKARSLRADPWLGHTVYGCKILYDPQHFLDFTQAAVRGLFHDPENVLARAQPQLQRARQAWLHWHNHAPEPGPQVVAQYLQTLSHIANALACLTGPPLTERRFLLEFPARVEKLGAPGLHAGFLALLGGLHLDASAIAAWLPAWEGAYQAAAQLPHCPPHLHAHRWPYYHLAVEATLEGQAPQAALWPLLRTWTQVIALLPPDDPCTHEWAQAFDHLDMLGDHFQHKLAALDAYLDSVEELFEAWKQEHGLHVA